MKHTLLYRSSWRYFLQHPLQLFFSVLGVALGVAIIVSIDMASYSARQGFNLSTRSLVGHASHRIISSETMIPESIYMQSRNSLGVRKTAPLIKKMVHLKLPDKKNKSVLTAQLTGIELFSEAEIRTWQQNLIESISADTLQRFLSEPNTVLVESEFLKQHQLKIGDKIILLKQTQLQPSHNTLQQPIYLSIIGQFKAPEVYQSQLTNWLLSDISTAQELLDYHGYISQIDLLLENESEQLTERLVEKIRDILPEGIQLIEVDEHTNAIARLSQSFELNLTALSLLGLLVAMFLIYNTMMFSVVQRRSLIARMRVLGVTRKELFRMILIEAFCISLIAISAGLIIGLGLAHVLLHFVTRTINDHYYVLQVTQLHWNYIIVLKALFLGVGATLISALIPALEAAYTKPVKVLQRNELEIKIHYWSNRLVLPGILGCLLVYFIVQQKVGGMVTGFASVFLLVISLICFLPYATRYLLVLLSIVMKYLFQLPGKIAVNNISRSLSRSLVAIATLTVSVSAALGIGIMVESFRFTVDDWLSGYLKADYFVASQDEDVSPHVESLDEQFLLSLSHLSGVEYISSNQDVNFFIDGQTHHLTVLDIPKNSFSAFKFKEGDSASAQHLWFEKDAVIVSEPYAYRHGLSLGEDIFLPVDTEAGQNYRRSFRIVGIYYHYGSEQGVVKMSRATYDRHWQKKSVNTLGLYLSDEMLQEQKKIDGFERQLQALISSRSLRFVSKQNLHEQSLMIFDRTFSITNVLKLLVILVSFVGILSALMAIELEREQEFAILRATGLTGKQLSTLVYIETLSMGIIAAAFAMPMGIALAYLLLEVVNYRSFGWSLQFILPLREFVIAAVLAISAAVLAGIYPARHLSKMQPALALRGG